MCVHHVCGMVPPSPQRADTRRGRRGVPPGNAGLTFPPAPVAYVSSSIGIYTKYLISNIKEAEVVKFREFRLLLMEIEKKLLFKFTWFFCFHLLLLHLNYKFQNWDISLCHQLFNHAKTEDC